MGGEVEGLQSVLVRELGQPPDHLPVRPEQDRGEGLTVRGLRGVLVPPRGPGVREVCRELLEDGRGEARDPRSGRQGRRGRADELPGGVQVHVQVRARRLVVDGGGPDPEADPISHAPDPARWATTRLWVVHNAQVSTPRDAPSSGGRRGRRHRDHRLRAQGHHWFHPVGHAGDHGRQAPGPRAERTATAAAGTAVRRRRGSVRRR